MRALWCRSVTQLSRRVNSQAAELWHSSAGRRREWPRHRVGVAVFAVFAVLMIMPAGVTPLAKSDVWSFAEHAHGVVQHLGVRGQADSQGYSVWVWRPPGSDSALIPVLYFLHGNPGGPSDAFRYGLAEILDERLEQGYPPFVVACPDGNGDHHWDTEWADAADRSDMVESPAT